MGVAKVERGPGEGEKACTHFGPLIMCRGSVQTVNKSFKALCIT